MPADHKARFSGRASFYARYRPGYPDAIIPILRKHAHWNPTSTIADIGAGTGISSELFLRHGNPVWAVEPNADMRAEAALLKLRYPNLSVVDGVAEETTLPSSQFDFVIAATAFHWFDVDLCRREFKRILKPNGRVILIWNLYSSPPSPFMRAFEEVSARYRKQGRHSWARERHSIDTAVKKFFGDAVRKRYLDNHEQLAFEALQGRLLSTAFAPLPGDDLYEPMMRDLRALFGQFAVNGAVELRYQTALFYVRQPATAPAHD